MKISQKLEYACRALAQLARRHDGRSITRLEELAQREAISANFLVQILNDLRRAGLVESKRGKAGGYLLARDPGLISLRQIIEAMDPGLLQCTVSREGESGVGVRAAWQRAIELNANTLGEISLASMAESAGGEMFYI